MKVFKSIAYRHGKNCELPQIIVVLLASLPGLSAGLLFGWTSPTVPILINNPEYDITLEECSYFTVMSALSMGIAAILYPKVINKIGLKMSVLVNSIPYIITCILTAISQRLEILYLGRVIAGIGDAGMFCVTPIYVCEVVEAKIRDTWGNVVAYTIFIGIFLINVIGSYLSITTTALICLIVPLTHVITFAFVPESPYYLLGRNRKSEAKQCLQMLRWREDVDDELEQMEVDVKRQVSESGTIKDLFMIPSNRKAFIICFGIRTIQQFSGLTAFESYTQYLFGQVGGELSETISSIIFSAALMISVVLASMTSQKLNRKSLLVFSCFGCSACLLITCVYIGISQYAAIDTSSVSWISLVSLLGFIACEGGLGTLPTIMIGEMFSASVKNKASTIINLCFSLYILLVPKLFQTLTSNFGILYALSFFMICCFMGGIFCCFYIIETKGKTLEDIQQALKNSSKPIRENSHR